MTLSHVPSDVVTFGDRTPASNADLHDGLERLGRIIPRVLNVLAEEGENFEAALRFRRLGERYTPSAQT